MEGIERAIISAGKIAYRRAGSGEPVLLLHGIPTSSFLWRNVIPFLAGHYTVLAPDLLGYGDSDKPEDADLSVKAQGDYIGQFLHTMGVSSYIAVGHDIGGGVAQILAVRHPERVRKLALIDSIVDDSWPVPDIARLKDPAWDSIMQTVDLAKGFRKGFTRGMAAKEKVTEELIGAYARPFDGLEGRRAYLRCARALNNQDLLSISEQIASLTIPALVIWGQQDDFQPVEWGLRLIKKLGNSRLVVFPDGGHFLPEDKPEGIAKELIAFFQG